MMETFRSVSEELKQLSEERRNDAAAIAPSILEFETNADRASKQRALRRLPPLVSSSPE
jgi:hypothetical protein